MINSDIIDQDMNIKNNYSLKYVLIEYRKITNQRLTMKITEKFKQPDGTEFSKSMREKAQADANYENIAS